MWPNSSFLFSRQEKWPSKICNFRRFNFVLYSLMFLLAPPLYFLIAWDVLGRLGVIPSLLTHVKVQNHVHTLYYNILKLL